MADPNSPAPARRNAFTRFLDGVEWLGNLLPHPVTLFAILAVGLFNSIMFPTIFTITLEGQGDRKPQISGILCTAIFGGAIIPPLYGGMADALGYKAAFLVPVICYAYILWFTKRR